MQEVQPKENLLGLKVFINGIPDMTVILKEKAESILAALELEISKYYETLSTEAMCAERIKSHDQKWRKG